MPTGKVKWFDSEKGFGFLATEDGQEVFLHSSALPADQQDVVPGTRVEFGIVDGRRGAQALTVRVIGEPVSVAKAARKAPEEMTAITEDLIKVLEDLSNSFRRGRYPDKGAALKVAAVLRIVADDLEL